MPRALLVAAVLMFAAPALAGQCPMLIAKIDADLQTAQIDEDTRAKVVELRNAGEAEHNAGDHAASEASLNAALELLAQ